MLLLPSDSLPSVESPSSGQSSNDDELVMGKDNEELAEVKTYGLMLLG